MRVLLVLLSSFAVASCAHPLAVNSAPKLSPELFACDPDPGAWKPKADDVEVAVNETLRTKAGQSCRQQLHTVCSVLAVNGQVQGECPKNER